MPLLSFGRVSTALPSVSVPVATTLPPSVTVTVPPGTVPVAVTVTVTDACLVCLTEAGAWTETVAAALVTVRTAVAEDLASRLSPA